MKIRKKVDQRMQLALKAATAQIDRRMDLAFVFYIGGADAARRVMRNRYSGY